MAGDSMTKKPKRALKTVKSNLRFNPDLMARLDRHRASLAYKTTTTWLIEAAVEQILDRIEKQQSKEKR